MPQQEEAMNPNPALAKAFENIPRIKYGFEQAGLAPDTSAIDTRIAALEARVESLEKAHIMAGWHIQQFASGQLRDWKRQYLRVGPQWMPSHISAALRHLERGSSPDSREVAEATNPADDNS